MSTESINPYASPLFDDETPPCEPLRIKQFPMHFFHRSLTVEQYDAWTKGWTGAELRRTIEGVRMRKLKPDGPYHHLVLSISYKQKQQSDFPWMGKMDLRGVKDLVLYPDGIVTGRDYGNYPWPRYRFIPNEDTVAIIERNLLMIWNQIRKRWHACTESHQ